MNKIIILILILLLVSGFAIAQTPANSFHCKGDSCIVFFAEEKASLKRYVLTKYNDAKQTVLIKAAMKSFGYANSKGEIIIPVQYEDAQPFVNRYALIAEGGKQGIIDSTGKIVLAPSKYFCLSNVSEGVAFYSIKGDKVDGFVDLKGVEHPLPSLPKINTYRGGTVMVNYPMNLKRVLLDTKAAMNYYFSEGLAVLESTVIDREGKVVFSSIYYLSDCHSGRIRFRKKVAEDTYYYGYMDRSGKIIIPPMYIEASDFKDGKANVAAGTAKRSFPKVIGINGVEIK